MFDQLNTFKNSRVLPVARSDDLRDLCNEIEGYFGRPLCQNLVVFDGGYWYAKIRPARYKKRDVLGYELGKNVANVAIIRTLNLWEQIKVKKALGKLRNRRSCWISRVVQKHSGYEVLAKDLDSSVARELVYSTLIRRRDTHSFNRVYLDAPNIPVFYDYETAFLGEPVSADIRKFFTNAKMYDGSANSWAVIEAKKTSLSTKNVRNYERLMRPFSVHFVDNVATFEDQVYRTVECLKNFKWDIRHAARMAGLTIGEEKEIWRFLNKNLDSLESDCGLMLEVIHRNSKMIEGFDGEI